MTENELFEWMTDEQTAEWKAARASGGDTFLHVAAPDCGSDGLWMPEEDDGHWSASWVGVFFDVSEGEPYVGTWECDTDGNWDYDLMCPLSEYDAEAESREDLERSEAASLAYSKHVARTGEDPLSEFLVKRTYVRKERWTFKFVHTLSGVMFTRVRRGGSACVWIDACNAPTHVLQYAGVKDIPPAANQTLVPVDWAWGDVKLTPAGLFHATLERVMPRPERTVRRELKAAARKHLEMRRRDLANRRRRRK